MSEERQNVLPSVYGPLPSSERDDSHQSETCTRRRPRVCI